MARRLDIELTSCRNDGTWTWRAAGARQPRGEIEQKLLEDGAKVGDVLRVEAQFELEGITVLSVVPPRERVAPRDRIEIVPSSAEGAGSVTSSLVGRKGREGSKSGPVGRTTRERRTGASSRPPRQRDAGDSSETRRAARSRGAATERPLRDASRSSAPATNRRPRAAQPAGEDAAKTARRTRPRPPRLVPGTHHRDEFLSTLAPEQRVVAEQLAIGGLLAVRKAIAEDRASAAASGISGSSGEAVVELAEQLLPAVRRAVWLDRAEAAVAHLDSISLRDLRAAVVGGTARDDHGRELLARLREALQARVDKQRTEWEAEISRALGEHRVLHALRLSARAPDAGARISAALVQPLAESASAGLSKLTSPDRWLALLEAAATSPVRRAVKPEGMPDDPSGAVRHAAMLAAGRIPALAPMLGLAIPPPPRATGATTKVRPSRRQRPKSDGTQAAISGGSNTASQSVPNEPEASEEPIPLGEAEAPIEGGSAPEPSAIVGEDPVLDEEAPKPVDQVETTDVAERDEASVESVVPGDGFAPGQ